MFERAGGVGFVFTPYRVAGLKAAASPFFRFSCGTAVYNFHSAPNPQLIHCQSFILHLLPFRRPF